MDLTRFERANDNILYDPITKKFYSNEEVNLMIGESNNEDLKNTLSKVINWKNEAMKARESSDYWKKLHDAKTLEVSKWQSRAKSLETDVITARTLLSAAYPADKLAKYINSYYAQTGVKQRVKEGDKKILEGFMNYLFFRQEINVPDEVAE